MSYARVAAVTGSNKGIGYAIIRNLALRYPTSALNNGPLVIYLTARNADRGMQALSDIHLDPALVNAKALRKDGGLIDVKFQELDIESEKSIDGFRKFMQKEHEDGLDVIVNNAGVSLQGFGMRSGLRSLIWQEGGLLQLPYASADTLLDSDIVRRTLAINYYGTMSLTEQLLPHMCQSGRIVNMASMLGKLNKYSPEITSAFRQAAVSQAPTSTNHLMRQYQEAVDQGKAEADGWPTSAYSVSKAGVIGATMFLGKQLQRMHPERQLGINACCPGYVSTDMTKHRGRKTVDEGAKTPVHLALADLGGVSGEFWEHEEVSTW